MSSFQTVRGVFETQIRQDLLTAGVTADAIFFDNVGETPKPSDESYAVVSMGFVQTVQDVFPGDGGLETLQGTLNVVVYTPKNRGSKPGEDIICEVMKGFQTINRSMSQSGDPVMSANVRNIQGPITVESGERPHHVNTCSGVFTARVS